MLIHRFYAIVSPLFRKKRMRNFAREFNLDDSTRVLDIGGTVFNWRLLATRPRVTLLNLHHVSVADDQFEFRQGDALTIDLSKEKFDICFSNSVIEHIDESLQPRFAAQVRSAAPNYYVQTPYKWFFIEPHFLTVFVHWLPRRWQLRLMPFLSLQRLIRWSSSDEMRAHVSSISLLDRDEFQALFPDATIIEERFLFFTKSLIAMRRAGIEV